MIKTDRQLTEALRSIREFENARAAQSDAVRPENVDETMHRAKGAAQKAMITRLEREVSEYKALKAGDAAAIRVETLSDLPRALIQTRIAHGLTQKALATRLNVAVQQVQRWEQRDYENAGFGSLLDVAEALDFDISKLRASKREKAKSLDAGAARLGVIETSHRYHGETGMPAWPTWEGEAGFDPGRLLTILQKANTFNQTAIVQYCYMIGEKHKRLKETFRAQRPGIEVAEKYVELVTYLNDAFQMAAAHNFWFLREFFTSRGRTPPRICLKGNFSSDSTKWIVPIFRGSRVNYDSRVELSGNTGFAEIASSGSYYLENNMPDAVLRGKYTNPRLMISKIRTEFGKFSQEGVRTLSEAWPKYWSDFDADADQATFYKSTMIMPLKLWDREISDQFQELLENRQIDRNIFGYLCVDHVNEGYFDPSIDLNVSKIFADVLCTMVMLRMNFTNYSDTFKAVRKLPEVKEWDANSSRSPTENLSPRDFTMTALPQLETKPRRPNLVAVDAPLLKFLQSVD